MKVLMLGWELPPHNSGGLGVACEQLCRQLSQKDVDLEFILPYQAEHDQPFKVSAAIPQSVKHIQEAGMAYDSQTYHYTDGSLPATDLFGQQNHYERAVEAMADDREFDIIHAHDWLTFRAALRLKMRTNKPLLLHVHSIESDRAAGGHGNPLVRDIEELSLNLADKVLAVSDHTKRAIHRDYGVPLDRIEVVHNSINPSATEDLADQVTYAYLQQLKERGYTVVSNIGRLTIQKGLVNLLHAFAIVAKQEPKTMLLLVGAGEQYDELVALSAELGIGRNVLFAGFQRGQAWRDAFRVADLFVMPSVSEPFGLTPLEAASFGTPSLISKQSGVSEILTGALKVDFWDIHEMANQIVAAVRGPGLRESLLETARYEVGRMSWQKAADTVYEIYRTHHNQGAALA
jgi:glycosyltransferase involved in cell wall biosynthesis